MTKEFIHPVENEQREAYFLSIPLTDYGIYSRMTDRMAYHMLRRQQTTMLLLFFYLCSLSSESGLPINHVVPCSVINRTLLRYTKEEYTN